MNDIAIAVSANTPIGRVYISPNGIAHHPYRTGERRNGELVSTAEMSDQEIERAGLTGKVRRASAEANRLHG